jgi:glucosamine--fructose-6-phosphate aminotransferase (isomerizing)
VQDTAKEVAIFKAHNGKPLVLCARGETRFREHAERLIELPIIGAGLGFVLATVAGHLWGFYAAKAIDASAEELRNVRSMLAKVLEEPEGWDPDSLRSVGQVSEAYEGRGDERHRFRHLPLPGDVCSRTRRTALAGVKRQKQKSRGIVVSNRAIEDAGRPIDTIGIRQKLSLWAFLDRRKCCRLSC